MFGTKLARSAPAACASDMWICWRMNSRSDLISVAILLPQLCCLAIQDADINSCAITQAIRKKRHCVQRMSDTHAQLGHVVYSYSNESPVMPAKAEPCATLVFVPFRRKTPDDCSRLQNIVTNDRRFTDAGADDSGSRSCSASGPRASMTSRRSTTSRRASTPGSFARRTGSRRSIPTYGASSRTGRRIRKREPGPSTRERSLRTKSRCSRSSYENAGALIPANCYYEWKEMPVGKGPYCIRMADSSPFFIVARGKFGTRGSPRRSSRSRFLQPSRTKCRRRSTTGCQRRG